jgi:DNA-binding transcriptional regulator YdaS (Cro superfamily)
MPLEHDSDSALAKAVRASGSQTAFGRLIGKRQSVIHDWLRDRKPLPAEHVFAVEGATGISRHELRPDIYPVESSGTAIPPEGTSPAVPKLAAGGVPDSLKGLQT